MALVGLAHRFMSVTRLRLKKVPGLTLVRTIRLLEAALEEAEFKLPRTVALVDYHIRRNKVAKASHDKTWKEKHKDVIFLRL